MNKSVGSDFRRNEYVTWGKEVRYGSNQPWFEAWHETLSFNGILRPDKEHFYRSWDSSTVKLSSAPPKAAFRWEKRVFLHPSGPRLPYKITLPNGRKVWARERIHVYKYVRVPIKNKKRQSGLVAPPNFLDYRKLTVISSNCTGELKTASGNERYFYRGDLMMNLTSNGQLFGPDVQQYNNVGAIHAQLYSLEYQMRPKVISAFYENAKNQSVNVAQAIAERSQTIRMISDGAANLAKALLALKSGNLVRAARHVLPDSPKGVGKAHLAWAYGIQPLLSDLDGMAKHLAQPEDLQFKISQSLTQRIDLQKIGEWGPAGAISGKTEVWLSGKVTKKFACHVTAAALTREFSRLGFYNPVNLAWELVPFSFIADWFIPIGNYLNNLDAFSGLVIKDCYETTIFEQSIIVKKFYGGSNSAYGFTTEPHTAVRIFKNFVCKRQVLQNLPALPKPSFKDPATEAHVANTIALLTQLSRKKP